METNFSQPSSSSKIEQQLGEESNTNRLTQSCCATTKAGRVKQHSTRS